ncbi:MAG: recombinase RecA [Clostridia bacterium]|jgi:recombination protein RecA
MAKNETTYNANASTEDKLKALEVARLQIEKQYGLGSLMQLGKNVNALGIESIPSGSILLDEALGVGGYPRGRIIEIYGPESSGKTTLALHAIAEAQKKGGIAAFIDAEHALDPVYAKNLGVNTDELWVSQPDNGEQALEIAESLVRSGAVDIIVIDSVAALTPQAEIEGDMGDAHVGLQARLMSQALRKLTGTLSKSKTILVFINQIRMKIGVMFGNPETTTGGNALKFYASIRIEVRRIETIERGDDDAVGNKVRVKVVKNKVAPPFRRVELEIMFGKGLSASGSLVDAAVKCNIVDKKGAWYTYGDEKLGQGRENVKLTLEQNPELSAELEAKVRKIFFPPKDAVTIMGDAASGAPSGSGSTAPGVPATVAGSGTRGAGKSSAATASAAAEKLAVPSVSAASGPASKAASRAPAVPAEDDDGSLF